MGYRVSETFDRDNVGQVIALETVERSKPYTLNPDPWTLKFHRVFMKFQADLPVMSY